VRLGLVATLLLVTSGCDVDDGRPWPPGDGDAPLGVDSTGDDTDGGEATEGAAQNDGAAGETADAEGKDGQASGGDGGASEVDVIEPDGGGADTGPTFPDLEFCEGPTVFAYDPLDCSTPPAYPDNFFTVDADASLTGVRVDFTTARCPWLSQLVAPFDTVVPALNALDGFTTTGGIFLPWSGEVAEPPGSAAESLESTALQLWELGAKQPRRVPYEATLTDDGRTIMLLPLVALRPATLHAVVVTRDYVDAQGACLSPNARQRALLSGSPSTPEFERLTDWVDLLFASTGIEREDVSASLLFTTQSIHEESAAIAQRIREKSYAWKSAAECTEWNGLKQCDRVFTATDFRGAQGLDVDSEATYDLTIRFWFPNEVDRPWPAGIFAHGLGSGREQGDLLAPSLAAVGFATVALDAPGHSAHPTAPPPGTERLQVVLGFFGVDFAGFEIDPVHLRDVWRWSTYDKLQLIELLQADPDLDGDGTVDISPDGLAYLGASLGGIMAAETLALSDDIRAAIVMIAGARLSSVVADADQLGSYIPLVAPTLSPGEIDRVFSLVQTVAERGDGANWAPYVFRDRLEVGGDVPPHTLLTMAVPDEIVPNSTTAVLARCLGIPALSPVVLPISLLEVEPTLPVSGNLNEGTLTAGLFQYDRITENSGEPPRMVDHDDLPVSLESFLQTQHFLQTWWTTSLPEILDPYFELGTPPL
jgi:hypothetical protein